MRATAHLAGDKHANVLRLDLTRTPFQKRNINLVQCLPLCLQSMVRYFAPEHFLPSTVILKTLKRGWDDEFANEKIVYKRLESLQGRVIPSFLGNAIYNGKPSILISYIDGIMPYEQDKNCPMSVEEFNSKVEFAVRQMEPFGLSHGDMKLDNFIICGDRVMVIDLESVEDEAEDVLDFAIETHLEMLMSQYQIYLDNRFDR